MTATILAGIGLLATSSDAGEIADAAIVVEDDLVRWVGSAAQAPDADRWVDLDGQSVVPGFVDSHAHLVFAGDRSAEFVARMAGQRYGAGGIASTVAATRGATDEELRASLHRLVRELLRQGVTTFECKSGYGLDVASELRLLQLAGEMTTETTFLGGHVVPPGVARRDYLALLTGEMVAVCAPHARWVDVFCDRGAFDVDEAAEILRAGMAHGLLPRLHANQLETGPGVQLGVELGAASVDHCTFLTDGDVEALSGSQTVATLLPLAEFSTRSPFPDARRLLDAGVSVALATDCNPGSAYSTSMSLAIAFAVRDMHMSPREALWAATRGGAQALRREDVGRIEPGARADLVVLDAPSYVHLAYRPGVPLVSQVWQSGRRVV